MARLRPKTKTEANQEIVEKYLAAGEPWPASSLQIAAWAIRKGLWEAPRRSLIVLCAKDLAEAMRRETEPDPQGRTVRAKQCAQVVEKDQEGKLIQRTIWFDRSAEPDLVRRSLQQRRNAIAGACGKLKLYVDSYNDNNPYGATIQMSFNFEDDIAELEQSTEYKPVRPPDDDED